ncbi:hypothetical protein [uncultured Sphaerotilus sp.]|uniref:COG3904 family protein n=1 Tax=uncultured Sphaerotilus sp. TaxID=474984 RepID=UPI0030CA2E24
MITLSIAVNAAPLLEDTVVMVVPANPRIGNEGNIRDYSHIDISGDIKRGAAEKLQKAIPEARRIASTFNFDGTPVVRVILQSPGGEVMEAMRLGEILRRNAVEVWVLPGSACNSACVFVLSGGTSRVVSLGAKIGIHRPYFIPEEFARLSYGQSQNSYRKLADLARIYLRDMGIDDLLFTEMMRVESRKMNYISQEFVEAVGLDGNDPAYQEWQRARDIQAAGKNEIESIEKYTDCVSSGEDEKKCKRFLSKR